MSRRAISFKNERLPELRAAVIELSQPEHEDRAPEAVLEGLAGRFPALGKGLVELMTRDPSLRVHEQAALLVYFAARFGSDKLKTRVLEAARASMLEALHDPTVPDERKYALGPILAAAGHTLGDDEFAACFQDYEGTAERQSRESLTALLDVPEQVDAVLSFTGFAGGDQPLEEKQIIEGFERALETLLHNAPVGAVLACSLAAIAREKGVGIEPALAALEVVARTRTPRALWYLGELARWPDMGDIGERARTLVKASSGPKSAQRTGAFSHGLVSAPDGEGARDLVLFYRTAEGTLDGLAIVLDEKGIKDTFMAFGDGLSLEAQAWERFDSWSPCDLAFARDLVSHAFSLHESSRRPVPGRFLVYRPFLGEAPIVANSRKPELGAYALETIVPGAALVQGSEALAEHEVWGELGTTSIAAYAFVTSRKRRRLDDFIHEVVRPEKAILARRLAEALEIEARAGRARKPENRLAARVYLALETGLVALDKIPYVRALARVALDHVEKNVKKGFRSESEATAAS
ncbi:MAG TPA: hypothetical protein VFF73_10915 [Planctomycetota bacterium]|nr:hypothetical protein [Planctomycetota bacterium]